MTCMSDYIQLTNISKTFGKQTVLQPLTMGFEEGMIHGIIGRNGSGKTVLMKMILGILQPTTGTWEISESERMWISQRVRVRSLRRLSLFHI